MTKTIKEFRGTYNFLSNFYPSLVEYNSVGYPSAEHAYQAAKTFNKYQRRQICLASTPAIAKTLGKCVTLREDWEEVKNDIMLEILRNKFANHDLKVKLLSTGNAKLIEGNWWGDTYWGVCGGKGKNMLGALLMQVRKEIEE